MLTPQDISIGMLTITRIMDGIQKIKDLSDKTSDVEIKEIIVDLRSQLVETKDLLTSLKEENIELKQQIKILKTQKVEVLTFNNGAYHLKDDKRAFCSNCYETHQQKITLSALGSSHPAHKTLGNMKCPSCKQYFRVK